MSSLRRRIGELDNHRPPCTPHEVSQSISRRTEGIVDRAHATFWSETEVAGSRGRHQPERREGGGEKPADELGEGESTVHEILRREVHAILRAHMNAHVLFEWIITLPSPHRPLEGAPHLGVSCRAQPARVAPLPSEQCATPTRRRVEEDCTLSPPFCAR